MSNSYLKNVKKNMVIRPDSEQYCPESGAHAWVVDGWMERSRRYERVHRQTGAVTLIRTEHQNLVHCNWGWRGWYDGYYLSGLFDLNTGPTETEPDETGGTTDRDYDSDYCRLITYRLP